MKQIEKELDVSRHRACKAVEQPRSTQRHVERSDHGDREIIKCLQAMSRRHPRYGYRRVTVMLKREGMKINRKRVRLAMARSRLEGAGEEREEEAAGRQ